MRNVEGGIDSIDLRTGKVNWTTSSASVPIFVNASYLMSFKYINEHVIQIVKIDIQTGHSLMVSEPLTFPEGIKVAPTRDQAFDFQVEPGHGTVDLRWWGRSNYDGGAPPPPDVVQQWQKQLGGIFKVDLATGKVRSEVNENPSNPSRPPQSPLTSFENVSWKLDDQIVTLSSQRDTNGQALFIKPAKVIAQVRSRPIKLLGGSNLIVDVTEDGLFVLVRAKDSPHPIWQLFSAETGRKVGAVPYDSGAQQACVMNGQLFYLTAQTRNNLKDRVVTLKAVDVRSGQTLWSRDLKQFSDGPKPLPPATRVPN